MYKKILVPLDGSPLAEGVLGQVRELARCDDADIVLLRVTSYPLYDYTLTDPMLVVQLREAAEAEARSYLDGVTATLRAEGFRVTGEIREGPVAEMIINVAINLKADLIAMSTHGRTGLSRFILGSVANQVLHVSKVPVLVIRPEKAEDKKDAPARETVAL